MTATIMISGRRATCRDGEWECDDEELARLLNASRDPLGPSGADPNPDYNEARRVIGVFGGKLMQYTETESDLPAGGVF